MGRAGELWEDKGKESFKNENGWQCLHKDQGSTINVEDLRVNNDF